MTLRAVNVWHHYLNRLMTSRIISKYVTSLFTQLNYGTNSCFSICYVTIYKELWAACMSDCLVALVHKRAVYTGEAVSLHYRTSKQLAWEAVSLHYWTSEQLACERLSRCTTEQASSLHERLYRCTSTQESSLHERLSRCTIAMIFRRRALAANPERFLDLMRHDLWNMVHDTNVILLLKLGFKS